MHSKQVHPAQAAASASEDIGHLLTAVFNEHLCEFKRQHGKYSGWTAQIIQHEIDHCRGMQQRCKTLHSRSFVGFLKG